ncbi:MAG: hypothetical protein R2860_14100 [Desulfobacterales bacterium]
MLVETYLSGREFTVNRGHRTGRGPLGTLEVILLPGAEKGVYSYLNKEKCEELVEYRLRRRQRQVRQKGRKLWPWDAGRLWDAGRRPHRHPLR